MVGCVLKKRPNIVEENTPWYMSEMLSEREVAEILRVSPRTVGVWRRTRGLPAVRVGRKVVRYRRREVESWIASFNRKEEQ